MDSLHAWRTAFHLLYLPGDESPVRLLGKNLPCCWLSSGAGGRWSLVGGSTRTLMIPKPVGCFLEALQNWRCRQRKIRMLPRDFILRQTFMIFIPTTIKIKKEQNWRRFTCSRENQSQQACRGGHAENWWMWELGVSVTRRNETIADKVVQDDNVLIPPNNRALFRTLLFGGSQSTQSSRFFFSVFFFICFKIY